MSRCSERKEKVCDKEVIATPKEAHVTLYEGSPYIQKFRFTIHKEVKRSSKYEKKFEPMSRKAPRAPSAHIL